MSGRRSPFFGEHLHETVVPTLEDVFLKLTGHTIRA